MALHIDHRNLEVGEQLLQDGTKSAITEADHRLHQILVAQARVAAAQVSTERQRQPPVQALRACLQELLGHGAALGLVGHHGWEQLQQPPWPRPCVHTVDAEPQLGQAGEHGGAPALRCPVGPKGADDQLADQLDVRGTGPQFPQTRITTAPSVAFRGARFETLAKEPAN